MFVKFALLNLLALLNLHIYVPCGILIKIYIIACTYDHYYPSYCGDLKLTTSITLELVL